MKLHEPHFQWRQVTALEPGDVYLAPAGDGYWVCMASQGAEVGQRYEVILGEVGLVSGDRVPRFVHLPALGFDLVARCIDPRIEPVAAGKGVDGGLGLAMPGNAVLPGHLALDRNGKAYLHVRQNNASRYFDIAGGPTRGQLDSPMSFGAWRVLSHREREAPLVLAEHVAPA